jgi:hypothetical protein
MNEDVFNMSLRKFLKKVGVTSQREIEKAVREAIDAGRLRGDETLDVEVTLKLGGVALSETIDGRIELVWTKRPRPEPGRGGRWEWGREGDGGAGRPAPAICQRGSG